MKLFTSMEWDNYKSLSPIHPTNKCWSIEYLCHINMPFFHFQRTTAYTVFFRHSVLCCYSGHDKRKVHPLKTNTKNKKQNLTSSIFLDYNNTSVFFLNTLSHLDQYKNFFLKSQPFRKSRLVVGSTWEKPSAATCWRHISCI